MITKREKELQEQIDNLVARIEVLEKKLELVQLKKVEDANKKKQKWLYGDPVDSETSKRGIIR